MVYVWSFCGITRADPSRFARMAGRESHVLERAQENRRPIGRRFVSVQLADVEGIWGRSVTFQGDAGRFAPARALFGGGGLALIAVAIALILFSQGECGTAALPVAIGGLGAVDSAVPIGLTVGLLGGGLGLLLSLSGTHDAEIMLGVLKVIFGQHAVAGGVGIARELEIFLVHMRSRATDFDLRSGRIEGAIGIVALRPTAASARTFHLSPFVSGRPITLLAS